MIILILPGFLFAQESKTNIGVGFNYSYGSLFQAEGTVLKEYNNTSYGIRIGVGAGESQKEIEINRQEYKVDQTKIITTLSFQIMASDFFLIGVGTANTISSLSDDEKEIDQPFDTNTGLYFSVGISPLKHAPVFIGMSYISNFESGEGFGINLTVLF